MSLGSFVSHCPNCDLITPNDDIGKCAVCDKPYCSDCAIATSDPAQSTCSERCRIVFDTRREVELDLDLDNRLGGPLVWEAVAFVAQLRLDIERELIAPFVWQAVATCAGGEMLGAAA